MCIMAKRNPNPSTHLPPQKTPPKLLRQAETYHSVEGKIQDYEGRGAQTNPPNRFDPRMEAAVHWEAIDELPEPKRMTQFFEEHPKVIVNKVDSPDLGLMYSLNPYQGCEHGCVYCYARNAHEYWGFSAGLDFESKIIVKRNAPELLSKWFRNPNWRPAPIMLSGNTDCYQPVERKLGITRKLLELFWLHRAPVGMITKNGLIQRDLDIIEKLAAHNLAHVAISLTGLDEGLRRKLEPRTASYAKRLQTIEKLSKAGVRVTVMAAPMIPGLNLHELPAIIEAAANAGAVNAGYTVVRLNGQIGGIFKAWLYKAYPDRANKVWHQIQELHGGQVNDTKFGRRIKGEGVLSQTIKQMHQSALKRYMNGGQHSLLDVGQFRRTPEMLSLF